MSEKQETIFIKIKDFEEKRKLLDGILLERKDLLIKSASPGDDVFSVVPISLARNQLKCEFGTATTKKTNFNQVILQFGVGAEKYLTLCDCTFSEKTITLSLDSEIFRIQRREDFRLKLPTSYDAHFQVLFHNEKELKKPVKIPLIDLSAGGCRLSFKKNDFEIKKNDRLSGKIQLAGRKEILVDSTVKHIEENPTNDKILMLGAQFTKLSNASKTLLTGVVMDIYKRLFSRIA